MIVTSHNVFATFWKNLRELASRHFPRTY